MKDSIENFEDYYFLTLLKFLNSDVVAPYTTFHKKHSLKTNFLISNIIFVKISAVS